MTLHRLFLKNEEKRHCVLLIHPNCFEINRRKGRLNEEPDRRFLYADRGLFFREKRFNCFYDLGSGDGFR